MRLFEQYKDFVNQPRIRPLADVAIFAIITIFFHYMWWNMLGFFRATDFYNGVSGWLASRVYDGSLWVNVHILGMQIHPDNLTNTLNFPSVNGFITVNESCSGFKQMYQIFFLFLLFRGPWKHKVWYIPAAFVIMFLVNILRIVLLSVVLLHWSQHWDFFHMWIMRPFYYVVIFAEWVVWVEYFCRTPKVAVK